MGFLSSKSQATTQEVYTGIQVSTSLIGGCIPLVYGRQRIPYNLLWYGNFKGASSSGGGGKGGGGGSGSSTTYSAAFLAGLCIGPIVGINTVWHDKAIETLTSENLGFSLGGSAPTIWSFLTSYTPPGVAFTGYIAGIDMQVTGVASGNLLEGLAISGGGTASGTLIVDMGAAGGGPGGYTVNISQTVYSSGSPGALTASAGATGSQAIPYDHIAYVATPAYVLGTAAAMPNLNFEVDALLGYDIASGMFDCDPSAIITDYLTEPVHGAGFQGTIAPLTGHTNSWQACVMAQGLMFSPFEATQREASNFLADLMQCTNSDMFISAGTLKVFSYYDNPAGITLTTPDGTTWSYTPNLSPEFSFTDDDYLYKEGDDPVQVTRKPLSETHNNLNLQYKDRSDYYNNGTSNAYDLDSILSSQLRTMDPLSFDMITSSSVARMVAQLIVNADLFNRETYQFMVRADYAGLEPGDVIAITDANAGLIQQLARVTATEDSADDTFTVTALKITQTNHWSPIYNWLANAGFTADYNADPGNVQAPDLFLMPPLPGSIGQGGITVGIAIGGNSLNASWAGCQIYCSADGGNTYSAVGFIGPEGFPCYGVSTSAITAVPSVDTTNTLSIALTNTRAELSLATTNADADNKLTLMLIGSGATTEVIAYGSCTAGGSAGDYNLTYLYRGLYGTQPFAHAIGSPVVRLDGSIFQIALDPGQAGQTMWFKFLSYNTVGRYIVNGVADPQTIAAVTPYSYVLPNSQSIAGTATLIPRGHCSISDQVIYKATTASGAWDSDVVSAQANSSVSVSAQYNGNSGGAIGVGLVSSTASTLQPGSNMDFCFLFGASGWTIHEGNVAVLVDAITIHQNDLFQVTYDGFTVRYYYNGTNVWSTQKQGLSLFIGIAIFFPSGAMLSNVETTVGALATPAQFVATGQCIVNNTNAMKEGGSPAWDSAIKSLIGYGTCHITAKVNSVATNQNRVVFGLTTSPSLVLTNVTPNYAWYSDTSGSGLWTIVESGTAIATFVSPLTTDVPWITYDGTTVNYYLNDPSTPRRSTTNSSLFLYGCAVFYDPNGGINSLRFGPTTNLAVSDTPQLGVDAASQVISATSPSFNTNLRTASPFADMLTASGIFSGAPVGIDFSATMSVVLEGCSLNSPLEIVITRDGTAIGTAVVDLYNVVENIEPSGSSGPIQVWYIPTALIVNDTPPAGTHTYAAHLIAVTCNTFGSGIVGANCNGVALVLKVREYKK